VKVGVAEGKPLSGKVRAREPRGLKAVGSMAAGVGRWAAARSDVTGYGVRVCPLAPNGRPSLVVEVRFVLAGVAYFFARHFDVRTERTSSDPGAWLSRQLDREIRDARRCASRGEALELSRGERG
jgi:hypothetical protein